MIEIPKLVAILLVGFLVWYAMRWVNGAASPRTRRRSTATRRQQQPPRQRSPAIEDLTACRTCGTYVAPGAPSCGRPGCPQPG